MPRISKRTVDAAKPGEDRFFMWDDALKGFGLLVLPSGVRSFVYDYRTAEGRKRRATIGKVGTITPEQARTLAEDMAATVKEGGDPLGAKAEARQTKTLDEIFDLYLDSGRFGEKAPSTQAIDRGRIKRHLRPLLGRSYVTKLTAEDVRAALRDIRDGRTAVDERTGARGRARVTGGETTARDSIALLRAILAWAVEEGLAPTNPAAMVKLGSNGQRDTILEGADDYARLFGALATLEGEGRIRGAAADAIRVIALTGARRNEIAALKWGHVDLKACRIVLPPLAHKAGRRTGKDRIIALPAAAAEIIARQPGGAPEDFVFAPAKGAGPLSLSKPWREVREAAGLPEDIGLHGLRHTMASQLAMGGAGASEIQAALGHSTIAMAAKYVHWADGARQKLAERAAAPALVGLVAAEGRPPAEVVPIKKGK